MLDNEEAAQALLSFVETLIEKYPDVYIVTIKQLIDWMQHPVTLRNIGVSV